VGAEPQPVEPARHPHRHDDAGRLALQDFPIALAGVHRQKVGLQHALDEAFQDRRHVAAPQRKDEDEMIGGADRLARGDEIRLERLLTAIALVQDGVEVHLRQHEQSGLVTAGLGAAGIGLAERLAIAVRHGIADDDRDVCHGHLPRGRRGDSAPLRFRL